MGEREGLRQIHVRRRADHHLRHAQGEQGNEERLPVRVAAYQKVHRHLVESQQQQGHHEVFLKSPPPFHEAGEGQQRSHDDAVEDGEVERYGVQRVVFQHRCQIDRLQQLGCRLQYAHAEQQHHQVLHGPELEDRQRQVWLVVKLRPAECQQEEDHRQARRLPYRAAPPPIVVLTIGEQPHARDKERAPEHQSHEVDALEREKLAGPVSRLHHEIHDGAVDHQQGDDEEVHQSPVAVVG